MTLAERLEQWSIPEPNSGCLIWMGALNDKGYGRMKVAGRMRQAHVVAYELANGPIPLGLLPDHLCRTRCCINEAHLEPVTPGVNVRRGLRGQPQKFVCDECGDPYEVLARRPKVRRGCRRCWNARRRER
jgi:hypothetical protein